MLRCYMATLDAAPCFALRAATYCVYLCYRYARQRAFTMPYARYFRSAYALFRAAITPPLMPLRLRVACHAAACRYAMMFAAGTERAAAYYAFDAVSPPLFFFHFSWLAYYAIAAAAYKGAITMRRAPAAEGHSHADDVADIAYACR